MVCEACKALAERAERARSNFPRKASKVPKQLHCRSKLKISKTAWLLRVQIPKPLSNLSKLLKIFGFSES